MGKASPKTRGIGSGAWRPPGPKIQLKPGHPLDHFLPGRSGRIEDHPDRTRTVRKNHREHGERRDREGEVAWIFCGLCVLGRNKTTLWVFIFIDPVNFATLEAIPKPGPEMTMVIWFRVTREALRPATGHSAEKKRFHDRNLWSSFNSWKIPTEVISRPEIQRRNIQLILGRRSRWVWR